MNLFGATVHRLLSMFHTARENKQMATYDITSISLQAIKEGRANHSTTVTICPICNRAFIDLVEGASTDLICDECTQLERGK
jgi:hypothetical protein